MVPPAGFKPTSYALEERCLIQLDHSGMLLFIQRLLYYPLYEPQILLVRVEGLEPSIPYGRRILSALRIPFRHTRICLVPRVGNAPTPTDYESAVPL